MTLRTNARLAGFMFLFYIAIGITHMVLFNQATRGAEGTAATLASIARHAPLVRVTVLLTLLEAFSALVLAVTLYALTRDVDRDLALIALCCRVVEGVFGAIAASRTLQLLSVATASTAAVGSDAAAANALGAMLLSGGGSAGFGAFAVGSTLFCYLFLRGRSIPVPLAWLGLLASVLWVVAVPLQVTGFFRGPVLNYLMYIPMAVFEVTLALLLLIKGVAVPPPRQPRRLGMTA